MNKRYWVVGGEYHDCSFANLTSRPAAFGPFGSYDEARRAWEERSVESRPCANIRYTIAVEGA